MTSSRYSQITDELLSAYIDQVVTDEEKRLVEAAVAAEPQLAWRLETLRQTVHLLHTLPAVTLPRSFALSELHLAAAQPLAATQHATSAAQARSAPRRQPRSGFGAIWEAWQAFWRMGSPMLRNAAAVSLALFLFLVAGNLFVAPPQRMALPSDSESQLAAPVVSPASTAMAMVQPTVMPTAASGATVDETTESQAQPGVSAKVAVQQPAPVLADSNTAANAAAATAPAMEVQVTQAESSSADRPPGPDNSVEFFEEAPVVGTARTVPEMQAASTQVNMPFVAANSEVTTTDALSMTLATGEIDAAADAVSLSVAYSTASNELLTLPIGQVISDEAEVARLVVTTTVITTGVAAGTDSTPSPVATTAASNSEPPLENTDSGPVTNQATDLSKPAAGRTLLQWSQRMAALLTLILAMLWWRSRPRATKSI